MSMNGGNVSNSAARKITIAAQLTPAMFTARRAHRRESRNHAASQTTMAPSVTPESGPVGFQTSIAAATRGTASATSASTPRVKQPIAAASTAAAPGPLAGASRRASATRSTFHDHQVGAAANRRILVEHRSENARDRGGEERKAGQGRHRVPQPPEVRQALLISHEYVRHGGQGDRCEPGDVFLPFHPDVVPSGRGRVRQEKSLRISAEVCRSGG